MCCNTRHIHFSGGGSAEDPSSMQLRSRGRREGRSLRPCGGFRQLGGGDRAAVQRVRRRVVASQQSCSSPRQRNNRCSTKRFPPLCNLELPVIIVLRTLARCPPISFTDFLHTCRFPFNLQLLPGQNLTGYLNVQLAHP